jgi:hypothetical protein
MTEIKRQRDKLAMVFVAVRDERDQRFAKLLQLCVEPFNAHDHLFVGVVQGARNDVLLREFDDNEREYLDVVLSADMLRSFVFGHVNKNPKGERMDAYVLVDNWTDAYALTILLRALVESCAKFGVFEFDDGSTHQAWVRR